MGSKKTFRFINRETGEEISFYETEGIDDAQLEEHLYATRFQIAIQKRLFPNDLYWEEIPS